MTVSITMYGTDAQYWNAGPGDGPGGLVGILVNSNSTQNVVNFSATFGAEVYTGVLKGNFQFDGPISTLDKVTGTLYEGTIYRNGLIKEYNVITQGTELQNWFSPSDKTAQYLSQASTLNSGLTFVGAQGGQAFGDTVIGGTANDSFTSFGGKLPTGQQAYFDGKGGVDISIMQGKLSDYKVETKTFTDLTDMSYKVQLGGWQITDSVTSRNGVTNLTNVERLKFTDTNVALDVGPTQNAGSVYMIYKAAFNRAPDASGMGYWLAQKDNGSNIVTNIAQGFVNSAEFTAKYGTNPSNATYIDKLYQNVLGRSGDSGGIAYWNQQLDNGSVSKAAALAAFATLPEGASNVASLIANGIPYTEFLG